MSDRLAAHQRGHASETKAALWLRLKGYRILARRLKTHAGEIDLVAAAPFGPVCFVEVKARKSETIAVEAVSFQSQYRIRAASDLWLARQSKAAELSLRYDIVAVRPWRLPRHFVDAF